MPHAFTRRFRIRHYECDAYGHLNNVNYIRYMQETALDAAADVGWDVDKHRAVQRQWLIRETDIEYLLPLLYNEQVDVITWVQDFRRVRSHRVYEFRRVSDGALAAKAITDWVYINTENERPAKITPDVIAAFAPDGLPDAEPPERFPKAAPQPEGVFQLKHRVRWSEIDTVGHVNNAAYLGYCEDASTQVGRAFNWPMSRMLDVGFAMIARRYRIIYLQAAQLDDALTIATWISDGKRATATRHYEIIRDSDQAVLARGRALWVCFDLNRQRPMRFPEAFVTDFAPNTSLE